MDFLKLLNGNKTNVAGMLMILLGALPSMLGGMSPDNSALIAQLLPVLSGFAMLALRHAVSKLPTQFQDLIIKTIQPLIDKAIQDALKNQIPPVLKT